MRPDPLACHDCSLLYGGPGWLDVSIDDDAWNAISPTGGHGGILCITCIARKLEEAGISDVPIIIGSGPFRHDPDLWYQRGFKAGADTDSTSWHLERASEALQRVRELHDGQTCADREFRDGNGQWTCPTIRALDGEGCEDRG
jgi:hypothetical protein